MNVLEFILFLKIIINLTKIYTCFVCYKEIFLQMFAKAIKTLFFVNRIELTIIVKEELRRKKRKDKAIVTKNRIKHDVSMKYS